MSSGQEVGDIFAYGHGPTTALLRSPTVIIASIALWGMNIFLFQMFGIDHIRVITGGVSYMNDDTGQNDQGDGNENSIRIDGEEMIAKEKQKSSLEVTSSRCLLLSIFLFLLLHTTTSICINVLDLKTVEAILLFYFITILGVMVPLRSTEWIRNAGKVVFYRAAQLFRPRCACATDATHVPVPFIDVFFADGMCSLSKVFFDWGMIWHLASHYPHEVTPSVHSILIPSVFGALPYIIRARQCIVMFYVGKAKHDPKRYQHTLNAIKYSTSLFPICLSAYQKTISEDSADEIENYLIALLTINSMYAYAWDIIMDWGMMQNPTVAISQSCSPNSSLEQKSGQGCAQLVLRPRLRFGGFLSTLILLADGIFRLGWVLRFYEYFLFANHDSYILYTEVLEVFRRSIWNLLRVEWENIKQMKARNNRKLANDDDEETSSVQMSPLVR